MYGHARQRLAPRRPHHPDLPPVVSIYSSGEWSADRLFYHQHGLDKHRFAVRDGGDARRFGERSYACRCRDNIRGPSSPTVNSREKPIPGPGGLGVVPTPGSCIPSGRGQDCAWRRAKYLMNAYQRDDAHSLGEARIPWRIIMILSLSERASEQTSGCFIEYWERTAKVPDLR